MDTEGQLLQLIQELRGDIDLEQWKDTYSKVSWAVAATLLALITASFYNVLIGI